MLKLLLIALLVSPFTFAQYVTIPDANFKTYLLQSTSNPFSDFYFIASDISGTPMQIDANSDGEIQIGEALNVYYLTINNIVITDITGIESFTNLIKLELISSNVSSFDISANINIRELNVISCPITSLDINSLTLLNSLNYSDCNFNLLDLSSVIPNLINLNCSGNNLSFIDLTGATNLSNLDCSNNNITSINFSETPNLIILNCSNNNIPSIDFSGLVNLSYFDCSYNTISTINFSDIPNLTTLNWGYNNLNSADLNGLSILTNLNISGNNLNTIDLSTVPNLINFSCNNNDLVDLDVSNLINLDYLNCNNNQLISLNLKNGTNEVAHYNQNPTLQYICEDENQLDTLILGLPNSTIVVNSYCSFTPGGNYNTIMGNIIFDTDNNGCDANDPSNLQYQKITILNSNTNGANFTDIEGGYKFYTPSGSFVITPNLEDVTSFSITPPNATVLFTNNTNNIAIKDFCISSNGNHPDIEVVFSPIIAARPGSDAIYELIYKNKGNQILSGNIQLTFNDNVLDLVSSTVNPTSVNTGNLSWIYSSLAPFETKSIELVFNVNSSLEIPSVNIADVLNFTASISPTAGDETAADNQFMLNQKVIGSLVPNSIVCLQGESLSPLKIGKYLYYSIEFENTGSTTVSNVVVKEFIDTSKYDISTLQVLNSSDEVFTVFNDNKIEYIFENIDLESQQRSTLLLKIKSVDSLNLGDTVSQVVDIYFDYNSPVRTNIAQTIYNDLTNGIKENTMDQSISVFPNPTIGNYVVNSDSQIKLIELFDINGRLISTKIVNDKSVKMNISEKEGGIYFIKSTTEKGAKVTEIIKE